MTVLVDTYDVPAHTIMSELYNTVCYEVCPEEVYEKCAYDPKKGKKYVIMTDISAKTLLALRDIESVIYVFHREMLTEKEYKAIAYYTNELVYVEGHVVKVLNKKAKKKAEYKIVAKKGLMHTEQTLAKMEEKKTEVKKDVHTVQGTLTEKQKQEKEASLPYLSVQNEQAVYFPQEEQDDEDEDE